MLGIIFLLVQAGVSLFALHRIRVFDVLPTKYLVLLVVVLMLCILLVTVLQFFDITNIIGDVLSVLVTIALIWVIIAVGRVSKTLQTGMKAKGTTDIAMQLIVMNDSEAATVNDVADGVIGICNKEEDYERYVDAAKKLSSDTGIEIQAIEYADEISLATALVKGEVKGIFLVSGYKSIVDDYFQALGEDDECFLGTMENGIVKAFSDATKIVKTYTLTVEVEKTPEVTEAGYKGDNTEREIIKTSITPFVVYISGRDTYGDISEFSHSDVNLIVCVNPVTKQVLMVSTPRDSYLPIPGVTDGSGYYDKLTHAALYGKNCSASIATLEHCYGVDVDYYVKVNFSSLEDIVDALGGVSVYSAYDFDSMNILGYHFNKGFNDVDGERALVFCRERYAFPDGDYQRGRDHLEMIKAILRKAMSPAILTSYSEILDQVSGNVETNIAMEEITELVKMQLNDSAEWNFVSYSAKPANNGEMRYTYSAPSQTLYVGILDPDSIQEASDLMEKVLNGEILPKDDTPTS